MKKRWKPSKAQRREFAIKMQDPDEKAAYETRKEAKAQKRRNGSRFGYETAGGNYVPTKEQHDFAMNRPPNLTNEQSTACDMIITGYVTKEKVHHDYIHIVNELRRSHGQ